MEEGNNLENHLTSAAAFVKGGIQEAYDDSCSICLEDFCYRDPSALCDKSVEDKLNLTKIGIYWLLFGIRDQCSTLNYLVSDVSKNLGPKSSSSILAAMDEIKDNLYYISDVVYAGILDVGKLIMENILKLLIFPLVLPSLRIETAKLCLARDSNHFCASSCSNFSNSSCLWEFQSHLARLR